MFQRIETMGGVLQDAVGTAIAYIGGSGRRDALLVLAAAGAGYLSAALIGVLARGAEPSLTRRVLAAIRLPVGLSIGSLGLFWSLFRLIQLIPLRAKIGIGQKSHKG